MKPKRDRLSRIIYQRYRTHYRVYFELSDGNIYEAHFDVMERYPVERGDDLQLVSARVIGRKMQVV